MSELTKATFVSGKILPAIDADDVTAIRTEIHYSRTKDHRFQEFVQVGLVFFDLDLGVNQIEDQSRRRAEDFIIELADAIRENRKA